MRKILAGPASLQLLETAEISLAEIWSYFAEKPTFAGEFMSRFGDRFNQILQFPLSGPLAHASLDLGVVLYEQYAMFERTPAKGGGGQG